MTDYGLVCIGAGIAVAGWLIGAGLKEAAMQLRLGWQETAKGGGER